MTRLLFALVATLSMLGLPKAGYAALVKLDYVSRPLFCITPRGCSFPESYTERGSIFVDTHLLPGGNLIDTTIQLEWAWREGPFRRYTVNRPSGSFSGDIPFTERSVLDWTSIGITSTGYFANDLIGYTIDAGGFTISFNALGMVSLWSGRNMIGGSDDPYTGPKGDGSEIYASNGPGRWKVIDMTPIPLPASALLLLSGFVGLLLARSMTLGKTRAAPLP